MTRNIVAILILVLISGFVHAGTTTFTCDYKSYSDQDGKHQVKTEFVLQFLIDRDTGKAYMLGNNGSSEVQVFFGVSSISFVEVTATQNIMSTAKIGRAQV